MTSADDMNCGTLFESAELLEPLDALERSWFPLNESGEKIATISVDADVPEWRRGRRTRFIARKRDATPREIESPAIVRRDHLDVVRVAGFGLVFERTGGSYHFQAEIVLKNVNEPVDEAGLDRRFVTLHIDDVPKTTQPGSHFGNPIGPALVFG